MASPIPAPDRRRPGWTLALLAFAQLIIALDITVIYVALPEIGTELAFSPQTLQWVISAYAVTFGGFLLLGGRAADLLGRRRTFVAGLLLYAVASLAGGVALDGGLLVAARAVQGLGGALLFPATLSLVNTLFAEGPERNRALAVWGGAGASGLSLGALLGGVLTNAFGWEAVFFVNVPLAVLALAAAPVLLARDGASERGRGFDLPGALTVTAGVTLLVLVLVQGPETGWTSPAILASAALSAVLLAAFVRIEARSRSPLMPLRLLGNRSLLGALAITFTHSATFMALFYFLTLYFQNVHGYSALQAGLAFLPIAILVFVGTQVGERLTGRVGARVTMAVGLVAGAVGAVLFGVAMSGGGTYLGLLPGIVAYSVGMGMTWTSMWIAAATGVDGHEQGVAGAMASTTLQIGGAVGLAVLVAAANAGILPGLVGGLRLAAYLAAAGMVLGAVIALTVRSRTAVAPDGEREPVGAHSGG